jgi:hypothetical protein
MRRSLSLAAAVAVLTGALAFPSAVSATSGNGYSGWMISAATINFDPGYWAPGVHTYSIHYFATECDCDWIMGPYTFTVTKDAPLYPGNVLLPWQDTWGGAIWASGWLEVPGNTINVAQGTFFWGAWTADMTGASGPPDTVPEAKAFLAGASISWSWDGGDWIVGHQGPITNECANMVDCTSPSSAFFHRTWGQKF